MKKTKRNNKLVGAAVGGEEKGLQNTRTFNPSCVYYRRFANIRKEKFFVSPFKADRKSISRESGWKAGWSKIVDEDAVEEEWKWWVRRDMWMSV